MEQHRISGVGGLSVEAIQNAEQDKRAFWIMSNGLYHRLYTKEFKYDSPTSEDPIDTTSGVAYQLEKGEYNGFSWIRHLDKWIIIYSINKTLYTLKVNPNKKEIYERKCLNIYGENPQIFTNGEYYYITFLTQGNLAIMPTQDFVEFGDPNLEGHFTSKDSYYIKDTQLNIEEYFLVNKHIVNLLT